jgi:integrase
MALGELRQHRARQAADRLAAGDLWRDTGLVFATPLGLSVPPNALVRAWQRILRQADRSRVPFHATRHTAASLMVEAGVSPRVAQERLGHATVAITLDRYSHPGDALRRAAATAIDSVLQSG